MNLTKNKFFILSAFLGFLGFIDSTYLTITHIKNIIPPCNLRTGCETVLASTYSTIGPIPLAFLGVIFYLAIIILSIIVMLNTRKLYVRSLIFTIYVGLLVSIQLFLLQAVVLHAFCQYCLFSELISILLLLISFPIIKSTKD